MRQGRKRLPALALSALLAALAVAVAGCGGGARLSKAEYEAEVAAIGRDLEARFGDLGSRLGASDLSSLAALLARLGEALDTAAGRLSQLKPPEEVQAAQDQLVQAARDLADRAREVADTLQEAPLSELVSLQDELDLTRSDAFRRLEQALDELKAKGYSLGRLAG